MTDIGIRRGTGGSVQWLLDDLVDRTPGCDRAVLVSADGLLIARSRDVDEEAGEHLAALAAALQGLARSASRQLGAGRPRQTLIEMDQAFLLVTTAGDGTALAVVLPADADLGHVAYEINRLVSRVGAHLAVDPRATQSGDPRSTRSGDPRADLRTTAVPPDPGAP